LHTRFYPSPSISTTLPSIYILPITPRFHPFPTLHFTSLPFTSLHYTQICGLLRSYSIFPHFQINNTIFEKHLLNIIYVFRFAVQLLSETYFILRRTELDMIKTYIVLRVKYSNSGRVAAAREMPHFLFH